MPIDLTASSDRKLAYFRLFGTATVAQSADSLRLWADRPDFSARYIMLVDMEPATAIEANFLGIVFAAERLLPTFSRFLPGALCVLHAPQDVAFGVARMVQQIVEPLSSITFDICRDAAPALAAAGQPETTFAALDRRLGLSPVPPTAPGSRPATAHGPLPSGLAASTPPHRLSGPLPRTRFLP